MKCSECGRDISDPLDQYGVKEYPLCRSCDRELQFDDYYSDSYFGLSGKPGQLGLWNKEENCENPLA